MSAASHIFVTTTIACIRDFPGIICLLLKKKLYESGFFLSLLLSLCVCRFMCTCMHICGRPEVSVKCLPQSLSIVFLETNLFLSPLFWEECLLDYPSWPVNLRNPPACISPVLEFQACVTGPSFLCGFSRLSSGFYVCRASTLPTDSSLDSFLILHHFTK